MALDDDVSELDEVHSVEPAVYSNLSRSRQKKRITITIEHADSKTLSSFLIVALQSEVRISFCSGGLWYINVILFLYKR